jgi:hypothetical protein
MPSIVFGRAGCSPNCVLHVNKRIPEQQKQQQQKQKQMSRQISKNPDDRNGATSSILIGSHHGKGLRNEYSSEQLSVALKPEFFHLLACTD